ncbi:cytochrome b [Acetobacter orleanensis]|uniref:Cytochrome b n=1 Tax=Acetobacter orleanensis TaxID=104099 RepID=A0A4Y3TPX2_9PROT|nr:cytochrome b/b6 domain-containing protein [Acetobacter orleanensis]GAN67770.1 cytochrome b561 [Acetobacter orleanensis JCM 7639]GEB83107.1 cytochrome b [Acetobacter orleanensis]
MPKAIPDITHTLRYDRPTIILHWATAFLVLLLFTLGESWSWPPKPVHHLMIISHLTVGILLTPLIISRIIWRVTKGRHLSNPLQSLDRFFALGAEYTLYMLLVVEIVLGYLWRWGAGKAMSFFGLLLPSPFVRFPTPLLHWIQDIHHWNAWLIVVIASGHGMAAIFHHIILKDEILERMLPRKSSPPKPLPTQKP